MEIFVINTLTIIILIVTIILEVGVAYLLYVNRVVLFRFVLFNDCGDNSVRIPNIWKTKKKN